MASNYYQSFIGKVLDKRYKINNILGEGGMSLVFEAFDTVTGKTVAIKVLKAEMAIDETATKRFINESRAVSMLSHDHIVKVHDVSMKKSLKYIVMERINGITLKRYIKQKGRLSTSETLSYTEQILLALAHAHSRGIVHRDIKPQNVLLYKSGKIKVSDFGIATIENSEENYDHKAVGTVYYISPEQAGGKKTDARTDIYSVGIMMYEMATGVLPFTADTPVEIARKHLTMMPRRPRDINPDIPLGLEQIILGAIEKNPDLRFQSAEQMLAYVSKLYQNPDKVFRTVRKDTGTIVPEKKDMGQKKKRKKQSSSMFPIICGVTLSFLIVFITAGLYLVDMIIKSESKNTPITVDVPEVVGQIYDDNIKAKFDPSLFEVTVEAKYDADHEENTIIKQDPVGGSKRKALKNKQLCPVTLTVSKGSQMVKVPDFTVTDYRTAQIKAEKLGLKVITRDIYSDTVEIGYVVSTSPAAKSEVEMGSTITLYYSKGSDVTTYSVPKLTSLTPASAYSKMDGKFKVGDVTYEWSSTEKEGYIISQSIPSGTQAPKGTRINFVISKGPDPSAVIPEVE